MAFGRSHWTAWSAMRLHNENQGDRLGFDVAHDRWDEVHWQGWVGHAHKVVRRADTMET